MKFNLTREIELDLTFWLVYTLLLVPENNSRREINVKDRHCDIVYLLFISEISTLSTLSDCFTFYYDQRQ